MCAIGFVVESNKIHLYSDGYSREAKTIEGPGIESWNYSKIHQTGDSVILGMGFWTNDLYKKIHALRGTATEVANEASRLFKEYFDNYEKKIDHGTQIHVFGWENGKHKVYHMHSDDNFMVKEIPIPDDVIFGGMGLNGVEEDPGFSELTNEKFMTRLMQNPRPLLDWQECGLEAFREIIAKYKAKKVGRFGGRIFTYTIDRNEGETK